MHKHLSFYPPLEKFQSMEIDYSNINENSLPYMDDSDISYKYAYFIL